MTSLSLEGRYHPRDNLLVCSFDKNTTIAGVTTRSSVVGAPIPFARKVIERGKVRALIVNAGNANTCTGKQGEQDLINITNALAHKLSSKNDIISEKEIVMASTGVIGEFLNTNALIDSFNNLHTDSNHKWLSAATAIATTDTFPKAVFSSLKIKEEKFSICGIAKGSGMIAPNMATMLAFIFTDISLPQKTLQEILNRVVEESFNAITVDGDTSTSDMVLLISTQKSSEPSSLEIKDFENKLSELCKSLAIQIVKDGEGVSKLIEVEIKNASSSEEAMTFAKSIADSPLVKTAIHGNDLNWGRIAMALGKTLIPINILDISINFGTFPIYKKGKMCDYNSEKCNQHIQESHVHISVDIAQGSADRTVYASDLTREYININASYRS